MAFSSSVYSTEANPRNQVCGLIRHLRLKLVSDGSVTQFAPVKQASNDEVFSRVSFVSRKVSSEEHERTGL
jgi:hypothetical protein